MLKRINFLSVPVTDQARALAFYTKQLGCTVFTDQTMGDQRWIELKVANAETKLVLHLTPGHVPDERTPGVAFLADDVQKTYDELRERGVEFVQPPKKEPWGEYAIFKDSEGNRCLFAKG
jgi:predicted enzyme related to lactoylglutathione lyase